MEQNVNKCTKPDCDCIQKAIEKNGGDEVKSYPCLYHGITSEMLAKDFKPKSMTNENQSPEEIAEKEYPEIPHLGHRLHLKEQAAFIKGYNLALSSAKNAQPQPPLSLEEAETALINEAEEYAKSVSQTPIYINCIAEGYIEAATKYQSLLKQEREKTEKLREALGLLVHLHGCEQEGIYEGMPTPEQWMDAVEKASNALYE